MELELEVKDMTCGHCTSVITKAVKEVDAQAEVDIDVATKTVRIGSVHSAADFLSAIKEIGYTPAIRTHRGNLANKP